MKKNVPFLIFMSVVVLFLVGLIYVILQEIYVTKNTNQLIYEITNNTTDEEQINPKINSESDINNTSDISEDEIKNEANNEEEEIQVDPTPTETELEQDTEKKQQEEEKIETKEVTASVVYNQDFGVFIGSSGDKLKLTDTYETIVISASYFTNDQVANLRNNSENIYAYINLGALENFRSYYDDWKHLKVANYENWDEEIWIDINDYGWQDFFIDEIAKKLADKEIDGFFIDNVDVYNFLRSEETMNSILSMINRLKNNYDADIIVNGGYQFATDMMDQNKDFSSTFDKIAIESIYTEIVDYQNDIFGIRDSTQMGYNIEYTERLQSFGIDIYSIEYMKNQDSIKYIEQLANENGHYLYISNSVSLK